METVEGLKAALRREQNKRAEAEQARDVALSRVEQLMADNETAVEQTVRMKLKSEKMAQKALANANKKSRKEALAVKKELSYLRSTGQERVNKARQERDEFERQLRSVKEKLNKSVAQRRSLKESSNTDKRALHQLQKEYNELLLNVNLEREELSQERDSLRASAQEEVLAEKRVVEKLAAQKLKLKRRLKDARAELSNAEAEVRVERHTAEQLRADIAHRAQQFKLLKDQITGVQNMMEESRKASEAEKVRFLTQLKEAEKVESALRAKLQEEHTLLETAHRLIDSEQEVAKMLRKDILVREDEVNDLKDQLKEQTKRTAEVESLAQQRQNALDSLQEKLDAKLEEEQKLLAHIKLQKSRFAQFEADKKAHEEKLARSQKNALESATRLQRLEDALQARNISPDFLLAPVAVQTKAPSEPSEERPPTTNKSRTRRSSKNARHSGGARSDSAVTDKSFRSTSRSRSDRSRSRRHRSSSRNRKTQQPRSNSSGDTKRDTDATPVRRRVGWKP